MLGTRVDSVDLTLNQVLSSAQIFVLGTSDCSSVASISARACILALSTGPFYYNGRDRDLR